MPGDVARRIADLTPAQRALLEQRLLEQGRSAASVAAIPRRDPAVPCPLSFSQQRLWFLKQMNPEAPIYHIGNVVQLDGVLDADALQQAIDATVARHEALRTTFVSDAGEPVQVVSPARTVRLERIDLRGQALDRSALDAEMARRSRQPFDLSTDPILRLTLYRLGETDHLLLLNMHHIATDGWSGNVLLRDLGAYYASIVDRIPAVLPPLPIQYPDFALWQRRRLQGEQLDAQIDYWRRQLAGAAPLLPLPTDRPRPAIQRHRGARVRLSLPAELTEALNALSVRSGCTLFMTLLAGWQTLLCRYTAQTDIIVGTPTAGRSRSETHDLIGFFANTLPLRTDLSGNPTFRTLLERVRQVAMDAYAHDNLPFERIIEAIRPQRDLSYSPLFQVMFTFHALPRQVIRLPSLTMSREEIGLGNALFDLTLRLWEIDGRLQGYLEYDIDLFDAATIERMAGHVETLLAAMAADPDQPIATAPLLTPAERHQLQVVWNATRAPLPDGVCLHALIADQAARTPDAVAVVDDRQSVGYGDLDRRANQLAHHLIALGVRPGARVAIASERTVDMLVGLLGILKAGAAYVPLDPACPPQRLAFQIGDSDIGHVVSDESVAFLLPDTDARTILLDADWPAIARQPCSPPEVAITPAAVAYLIYTSGSTGTPKGVPIPHRAIVNFLRSMGRSPGISAEDRILAVGSLAFDVAALELWLPLCAGARVVLVSTDVATDGDRLHQRVLEAGPTLMIATPSLWRLLVEAGWTGDPRLRLMSVGEALPRDLAAALTRRSAAVWNGYGPTETTVLSTIARIEPPLDVIPIGRPIANTTLHVLDAALQPVPIGVPGELHIGGAGVAGGYWRRPALSAERFIADPFDPTPGARLYRTGDSVRYRPDGALEYLGRLDRQVKVRGFRIELGEVEHALVGQAGVRDAAVLAVANRPGDTRLVAFIVPRTEGPGPGRSTLRRALLHSLPDYMVPTAYFTVDALPLTTSGKVDRLALAGRLASTSAASPGPATEAVRAPGDAIEARLLGLWEAVLDVRPVGALDNFFDLGGHSLLAIRLVSRIEQAFGTTLPVSALFQAPTVAELGAMLREAPARPH